MLLLPHPCWPACGRSIFSKLSSSACVLSAGAHAGHGVLLLPEPSAGERHGAHPGGGHQPRHHHHPVSAQFSLSAAVFWASIQWRSSWCEAHWGQARWGVGGAAAERQGATSGGGHQPRHHHHPVSACGGCPSFRCTAPHLQCLAAAPTTSPARPPHCPAGPHPAARGGCVRSAHLQPPSTSVHMQRHQLPRAARHSHRPAGPAADHQHAAIWGEGDPEDPGHPVRLVPLFGGACDVWWRRHFRGACDVSIAARQPAVREVWGAPAARPARTCVHGERNGKALG